MHLFTPPSPTFSSGHYLEHVADLQAPRADERRQAKRNQHTGKIDQHKIQEETLTAKDPNVVSREKQSCSIGAAAALGFETCKPLPEARKDSLNLKTELLTGPAEALSITDRAGCERRHFKISSDPSERASA